MNAPAANYTPPLGYAILTPFYDLAIALMTREAVWRNLLIKELAPQAGERILDVGSGTGSLAVAVQRRAPECRYIGVDPDADAVRMASRKAVRAKVSADFHIGFLSAAEIPTDQQPDKIVSSLVLHQVPLAEKGRILEQAHTCLNPGGGLFIADYGEQSSVLMRALFRLMVQSVDGKEDTQPNADGVLISLMLDAGFVDVVEVTRLPTPTGSISIYSANKAASDKDRAHGSR